MKTEKDMEISQESLVKAFHATKTNFSLIEWDEATQSWNIMFPDQPTLEQMHHIMSTSILGLTWAGYPVNMFVSQIVPH